MDVIEQDGYPEDFLRGVSTLNGNLTSEGYVAIGVFQFNENGAEYRNIDGFLEMSINWNDEENSIINLKEQHKPFHTDRQFKEGYCKIKTDMVMRLRDSYRDYFNYERRPIEANEEEDIQANPYHGNLLLHKNTSDQLKRLIQSSLATSAVKIHSWDELNGRDEESKMTKFFSPLTNSLKILLQLFKNLLN